MINKFGDIVILGISLGVQYGLILLNLLLLVPPIFSSTPLILVVFSRNFDFLNIQGYLYICIFNTEHENLEYVDYS